MRINPRHNYVLREAMRRWGPIEIRRVGDMTPWDPWENVRPFVVLAFNVLEERYWLSRFFSRAMASQMDRRFPPVRRGQWFFSITQALVRLIEGLLTKSAGPPQPEPRLYDMRA